MKIDILKSETVTDEGRKKTDTKIIYQPWCEIKDLYSKEIYEALQIGLENVIAFEVRCCNIVKNMWRDMKSYTIVYDGATYKPYEIRYANKSKTKILIKASMID